MVAAALSNYGWQRMSGLVCLLLASVIAHAQIELTLFFRDDCNHRLRTLEYDILNLTTPGAPLASRQSRVVVPAKGTYLVSSSFVSGTRVSSFELTIVLSEFGRQMDTLLIPRIKFTADTAVQATEWNYFNCDRLCDGTELDFHTNGQKRLEGEFRAGKPVHLVEYRPDGSRERAIWYKAGLLEYERIEYFGPDGKLTAYATFRTTNRETIKRVYDAKGTLLNREVVRPPD